MNTECIHKWTHYGEVSECSLCNILIHTNRIKDHELIRKLEKELAEMKDRYRWRDLESPQEGQTCFVIFRDEYDDEVTDIGVYLSGGFHCRSRFLNEGEHIAWMPLPDKAVEG